MSFIASLLHPLIAFLNAYKWYFLVAILLYLVLTLLFRHSKAIITVIFGVCVLIFVVTHLGNVYGTINGLMTEVGENAKVVADEYSDYVSSNILSDESANAEEKLQRALNYGILGRETMDDEKLPTSDEMGLGETIDYIANTKNDGNNEGAAKAVLDNIVEFGKELFNELKALFGF